MSSIPHTSGAPGYVYIFRCQQFFKIGQSLKPMERLNNVQINNPFQVKVIKLLPTENMDETEDYLHVKFKAYHERGEWFLLPIDAVVWLMSLEDAKSIEHIVPAISDLAVIEEQARELRAQGYNKAETIKAIWNVSKGASTKYQRASEIYDALFIIPPEPNLYPALAAQQRERWEPEKVA